jgi:ankyrin repeat protein
MELVKHMTKEDLALINKDDNTALCFAAASGIKEIAEVMVRGNEELPLIRGKIALINKDDNTALCFATPSGIKEIAEVTPLNMAAMFGHRNMVSYLYGVTPFEELSRDEQISLLLSTISVDFYGTMPYY